jgi:hypothetical protein
MYDKFEAVDRWTGETLHCLWRANIVAIATRHADAVDVRFDVNDRPVWIALPADAWVEQKRRSGGHSITDRLAAQIAGHFLKQAIEDGYDSGREMYALSTEEVLQHLDAVMREAGNTANLPVLPVIADPIQQTLPSVTAARTPPASS